VTEFEAPEHEEVPYAVNVALEHLDNALNKMIECWQNRGWSESVVRGKVRAQLESLLEEFGS